MNSTTPTQESSNSAVSDSPSQASSHTHSSVSPSTRQPFAPVQSTFNCTDFASFASQPPAFLPSQSPSSFSTSVPAFQPNLSTHPPHFDVPLQYHYRYPPAPNPLFPPAPPRYVTFSLPYDQAIQDYHQKFKPRKVFTEEQINVLIERFNTKPNIVKLEREELGKRIGLKPDQIKTWFQNRRYKLKRGQLNDKNACSQKITMDLQSPKNSPVANENANQLPSGALAPQLANNFNFPSYNMLSQPPFIHQFCAQPPAQMPYFAPTDYQNFASNNENNPPLSAANFISPFGPNFNVYPLQPAYDPLSQMPNPQMMASFNQNMPNVKIEEENFANAEEEEDGSDISNEENE